MSDTENSIELDVRDRLYLHSLESSLQSSFRLMCSKEQMDLSRTLRILSRSERQDIKRCAKMWKRTPISTHEWNATIECLMTLRDRYQSQLDLMRVRSLESDDVRSDMLAHVQEYSRRLSESGQTHEELESLSGALEQLRRQWKKSKPEIESIIHSIISSTPLAASGCRVVRATRSNIGLLGLGYRSINKHYLVFESSRAPIEDCKEILTKIARDFGHVFEENAAQNLASMEGNYQHIFGANYEIGDQQQQAMQDIQQLADRIFNPQPSQNGLQRSRDEDSPLFTMTRPVFEPADWDWPVLLKPKQPSTRQSGWARPLLQRTFSLASRGANHKTTGLWSCSISRLADHFAKVGHDYYTNMLNNTTLMHSHQYQLFETSTRLLIKCYQALQIEHAHANILSTNVLVYQLRQEIQRANHDTIQ